MTEELEEALKGMVIEIEYITEEETGLSFGGWHMCVTVPYRGKNYLDEEFSGSLAPWNKKYMSEVENMVIRMIETLKQLPEEEDVQEETSV